jgi:hypothetical protein
MQQSTDSLPLALRAVPLPRGVHSYIEQPSGQTVYFATTSTGQLLNGEHRRRMRDETDAMIRDEMWRDLDRQDPLTVPPQLSVVAGGLYGRRGRARPG